MSLGPEKGTKQPWLCISFIYLSGEWYMHVRATFRVLFFLKKVKNIHETLIRSRFLILWISKWLFNLNEFWAIAFTLNYYYNSCGYLIRKWHYLENCFCKFLKSSLTWNSCVVFLDTFRGVKIPKIALGFAEWYFTMILFLASDWW